MEPLNTLPCVMLPHEVLSRWAFISDAEARWALVTFAASQLKFGRCRPSVEALRMHCKCTVEVWERVRVAVTSELEMDAEGLYGFRFIESARDAASLKSLKNSFIRWLGHHKGWGGSVLPPMYRGLVGKLPRELQERATNELLAVARGVRGVEKTAGFAQGAQATNVAGTNYERRPGGGPLVDGMKTPATNVLQQNKTNAKAPDGATATTTVINLESVTKRLDPPSNPSSRSSRKGSAMFPLRKDSRGGPRGGATMNTSQVKAAGRPTAAKRAAAKRRATA